MRQTIYRYRLTIICILGGFIIYAAAVLTDPSGSEIVTQIGRRSYGRSGSDVQLYITGLTDDALPVDISVSAQRYTAQELEAVFERCMEELPGMMLNGNASLEHVTHDLILPENMSISGISASWTSANRDLLKSDGRVLNDALDTPAEVSLLVELSDGSRRSMYTIPVKIYPKQYSYEQVLIDGLMQQLAAEDQKSITQPQLSLPSEYLGRAISFRTKAGDYNYIWILGVTAGVLFILRDRENARKAQKQKEMQMQLDYPEIISKLMVFTGAGLSVRSAIEAIAQDYRSRGSPIRYAYEEICILSNKLSSGVIESAAYNAFGRSNSGKPFMRLAGLLEQNRRSGLADLGLLLETEMRDAWESRKNLARRQGEEASTKLLLPLLMMLVLVMIMVMVPALMSM